MSRPVRGIDPYAGANFTPHFDWLDDVDGLTLAQSKLYGLLSRHSRLSPVAICNPTIARLAKDMRKDARDVRRCLRRLEELGLIAIDHAPNARGGPSVYTFLDHPARSAYLTPGQITPRVDSPPGEYHPRTNHPTGTFTPGQITPDPGGEITPDPGGEITPEPPGQITPDSKKLSERLKKQERDGRGLEISDVALVFGTVRKELGGAPYGGRDGTGFCRADYDVLSTATQCLNEHAAELDEAPRALCRRSILAWAAESWPRQQGWPVTNWARDPLRWLIKAPETASTTAQPGVPPELEAALAELSAAVDAGDFPRQQAAKRDIARCQEAAKPAQPYRVSA